MGAVIASRVELGREFPMSCDPILCPHSTPPGRNAARFDSEAHTESKEEGMATAKSATTPIRSVSAEYH